MNNRIKRLAALCLASMMLFTMAACGEGDELNNNLLTSKEDDRKVVNMFSPMEKTQPDVENVARSASDKTVIMAEEKENVKVEYITYTAEDYEDKTYDEISLNRARNNMDDIYLLNPDTIQILGEEGKMMDLSSLACAKNMRDVELPETPEDFLECCKVLKENGYETPIGANRWWLETFVLAQAFADLYNGGNTEAEIAALNSGESKYSDYMRPGFEFLQKLIDQGYIDAKTAYTYEAIDGEGSDFMAQKTPIVMAYWGAANTDTAYGATDFELQVIGFPTEQGQMPVLSVTGFAVGAEAEHAKDAMRALEVMLSDEALQIYTETNKVISPSKNVEVDCVPALRPLNDKIKENIYVLATNASMKVEQWGNTCLIVRNLLNGATVDQCMEEFDKLQEESLSK